MKIKLKWENYNGEISGIEFINSISTEDVGKAHKEKLEMIGIECEWYNEDELKEEEINVEKPKKKHKNE